jgi:hypothetical protein
MAAGLAASNVRPFLLMQFTSTVATVRYWSGYGTLTTGGYNWLGTGDLISISPIEENDTLTAAGITVKLSGVGIGPVTQALAELRTGQPGLLKLGLFDSSNVVIADPKTLFRGKLDAVAIDDKDPANPALLLSFENQLIDLKRPREWRFTNQSQEILYPGDRGFRFVEALQEKVLTWGWR